MNKLEIAIREFLEELCWNTTKLNPNTFRKKGRLINVHPDKISLFWNDRHVVHVLHEDVLKQEDRLLNYFLHN